jgi:hypothetical protein
MGADGPRLGGAVTGRRRLVLGLGVAVLAVAPVAMAAGGTLHFDAATWEPEPRPVGEGALALLANTVPARDRPEEALAAVSRACASALVLEGERGEAQDAAADLLLR